MQPTSPLLQESKQVAEGELGRGGVLGASGTPDCAYLEGEVTISQGEALQAGGRTAEPIEAEIRQVSQAGQVELTEIAQCLLDPCLLYTSDAADD